MAQKTLLHSLDCTQLTPDNSRLYCGFNLFSAKSPSVRAERKPRYIHREALMFYPLKYSVIELTYNLLMLDFAEVAKSSRHELLNLLSSSLGKGEAETIVLSLELETAVASRSENSELAGALREFLGLGANGPPNSPRRQGSKSSHVS